MLACFIYSLDSFLPFMVVILTLETMGSHIHSFRTPYTGLLKKYLCKATVLTIYCADLLFS